jgi:hypothetical protein
MEWKLRPFNVAAATAAVVLGLSVASSIAHAEVRQVGGTKAVWDKACVKSTSCLPVGDLGSGVNGYSAVNPDGSETNVYCTKTKCVGEDGPAPARQVPKPNQAMIEGLAGMGQLSGATGKPDPLKVIQGNQSRFPRL